MEAQHIPGRPSTPEPPPALAEVARTFSDPALAKVGLTTTRDGRWALLAGVRAGTPTPIAVVERAARGFPVVYVEVPSLPPEARPAFPSRGE